MSAAEGAATGLEGPSVVIVDDEVTLAVVMRTLVQQTWPDARITVFIEPQNLAPSLLEVPVGSLVLMDRRLGGVESYAIIRTLLDARPDVRVAMLSASLGPEEVTRARHAGAFAAYEKPAALAEWRQLLAQMLPSPVESTVQSGPAVA